MLGTNNKERKLKQLLLNSDNEKRYVAMVAVSYYIVMIKKHFNNTTNIADKMVMIKHAANEVNELAILDHTALVNIMSKILKLSDICGYVDNMKQNFYRASSFQEAMMIGTLFSEEEMLSINKHYKLFSSIVDTCGDVEFLNED